jgi:hypothetical protein
VIQNNKGTFFFRKAWRCEITQEQKECKCNKSESNTERGEKMHRMSILLAVFSTLNGSTIYCFICDKYNIIGRHVKQYHFATPNALYEISAILS